MIYGVTMHSVHEPLIHPEIDTVAEPVVPERYNVAPFCDPTAPNGSAAEIITNYDPSGFATARQLRQQAGRLYKEEKAGSSNGQRRDKIPRIDLMDPEHVDGLHHHVMVHAVTGLTRWGTSDTPNIPYWDREAANVGTILLDPGRADERIAVQDALSINALRSFSSFLVGRLSELHLDDQALTAARTRGQQTHQDISQRQQREHDSVTSELDIFSKLTAAKLKHLLWLTDQQTDPAVRQHLMPELEGLVAEAFDAGLSGSSLTVDMGVDTGISEDTYRPAYKIPAYVQLRHLGRDTYALPQENCHRLTVGTLLWSIGRPDVSKPFYEDGRYHLPWKIELATD